MAFKVSFFFQQKTAKTGGWSENFWAGVNDASSAANAAVELGYKLMALHGKTVALSAIRISEFGGFRRSQVFPQNYNDNPQVPDTYTADYPTNALLVRLSAPGNNPTGGGYVVHQWIKGIPDFVIADGGYYKPSFDFMSRMNAFFLTLQSQGFVLKVQDKSQPKKKINSISDTGVVTLPAHGYASGNYVRVSRARGYKYVNKVWRIQSIDANSFQLLFFTANNPPIPIYGDPVAQLQQSIFVSPLATGMRIVRATEHKVGRPFGLLSGRRTRRAS